MGDQALKIIISAKDQASAVIDKVNGSLSDATAGFDKAVGASQAFAAGLVAVAAGATAFVAQGIKVAATLETQKQGFVTLLGSVEKADEAINMIKKDAAATPFEITGLISANQLLSSVTKDANRSERFLLNVGKALTAMGKGQPELDRIIVNLQQIGAVGKASMIDLKQFAFAGIPIFDLLNEKMKGTGGTVIDNSKKISENSDKLAQLKGQLLVATTRQSEFNAKTSQSVKIQNQLRISDLTNQISKLSKETAGLNQENGKLVQGTNQLEDAIENGAITFELLEELFNSAGEAGGRFENAFRDQAGTFNQLWANLKDNISIAMADIVTQTGLFDLVKSYLKSFIDFVNNNKDDVIEFFKSISRIDFNSAEVQRSLMIIAGAITGGLLPAISALAVATIPLLPWLAIGASVALMLYNLNEIVKMLQNDWDLIAAGFREMWSGMGVWFVETVITPISTAFTTLVDGTKEAFSTLFNGLKSLAKGIANVFIGAVNAIISGLNTIRISIPGWVPGVGGKSFSVNLAQVPTYDMAEFEHGGIVPGPEGRAVPIMAHGQERIIPARASAGNVSGTITYQVIINNPTVSDQVGVNSMKKQIDEALRDLVRGHKLQTI